MIDFTEDAKEMSYRDSILGVHVNRPAKISLDRETLARAGSLSSGSFARSAIINNAEYFQAAQGSKITKLTIEPDGEDSFARDFGTFHCVTANAIESMPYTENG